jgi:cyclic pyranopterin phosphate synthase
LPYDEAGVALLDIVLGYDCNLACSYCTITDEMRRRALPTERVAREIERAAGRGFKDVAFTGGEPTIRSDLPALVKLARRRGFERVKVASNGLRYAHAAYLDHLVACGVDRFNVSMHAFSDAAYDETVQREGSAALRRQAIENLVARGLDPVADLILKEDTYRDVRPWIASLAGLGVRRFALWLVSLTDRNRENVHQLPRISDVVPFVIEAFDDARREGREVVSLHIPRCFLPGYEDHVRHPGDDLVTVVTPDDVFDLKSSRLSGGVKPEGCASCRYRDACPGLRADYIERFGGAEVRAVPPVEGAGGRDSAILISSSSDTMGR